MYLRQHTACANTHTRTHAMCLNINTPTHFSQDSQHIICGTVSSSDISAV